MVIAIVAIAGGLVALLAMLILVPALVHRVIGPQLEARVGEVYPADVVLLKDSKANSLGLTSRGVMQARGNGSLVLTKTVLHFFQFIPKSEVKIPLSAITAVDVVRTHLGKTIGFKLLRVSFEADGKADSIAWYVTNLDVWIAKLTELGAPQGANAES